MSIAFGLLLLLATEPPEKPRLAAATTQVQRFRIDASPRIDPVFEDSLALRGTIDSFFNVERNMEAARVKFSVEVHRTLALLPGKVTREGTAVREAAQEASSDCPRGVAESYRDAHQSGAEFLVLGRKLRELHRDIQRADELGDTIGLTPDYRLKAKQATGRYRTLLDDYREMRIAFHDQLNTELRYAGCPLRAMLRPTGSSQSVDGGASVGGTAVEIDPESDPADALAWNLGNAPSAEETEPAAAVLTRGRGAVAVAAADDDAAMDLQGGSAQAIWIDIDNRGCDQPSRLAVDGMTIGEIPPEQLTSVRARAGTRALCLLPVSDPRICGQPGTLRKTYLYDGLSLRVHCGKVTSPGTQSR